ncbi:RusA family crossover junction endodeoxyribonuclease [Paenibacillus riograndensis]|uniref:Rus n=1 Tax=Paenibacillus riograndensis SBR5 TaxID=1073571 RepID=A0A0E3WFZ5_9BACL|nr:RusA family crossover junction endodeoxyribonuclease [Paenibacillus riograndensis]CQR51452.1 rus [Paenibacillus riograndensis SBR5]
MPTEFFMPMKPPTATHQEKQVAVVDGKPVFYEPDDLKAARAKLTAHLGKHVPQKKYSGVALRVTVKWLFPIPEGSKHYDGEWKKTKPDTHNLNKLPFDIMTNLGFWKDDALVASEIIEKFWAKLPGIYIKIEEL